MPKTFKLTPVILIIIIIIFLVAYFLINQNKQKMNNPLPPQDLNFNQAQKDESKQKAVDFLNKEAGRISKQAELENR